jgi:FtsP/CotA-like multicopper oxidase with cupredoxin domain
MADADRLREQNDSVQPVEERAPESSQLTVSRRQFLGTATVAALGVTMSGLPWGSPAEAQSCAPSGEELLDLISSGFRQGTIRATNERRTLTLMDNTGNTTCSTPMLRFFEGYNAGGTKVWPPANRAGLPNPGPTLVTRLGEPVNIAFVNNVDPKAFPGTIDTGHVPGDPPAAGCDVAANQNPPALTGAPPTPPPPPDPNWLPKLDTYPNCLHGSNACNLHFHGTHVTPAGFGDNVYVMVEADPTMKPADYMPAFQEIFANCSKYASGPVNWKTAAPQSWQDTQDRLLKAYDANTQFRGQRGLPPAASLFNQNQKAGEWPPYHMGAFPNCFTPPATPPNPKNPWSMGQAPGTHWYHAHKHGSTAMHLFHGLAGAVIIRGKYDDDLRRIYPKLSEKLLVIQEYNELPNLYRGGGPRAILINGQFHPKITMQSGEIQLWRLVNATQGTLVSLTFPTGTQVMQIAQDGVQFAWQNYTAQPFKAPFSLFWPGNRMDLLVKAPPQPGPVQTTTPIFPTSPVLFNIALQGQGPDMQFPPGGPRYPIVFPQFLQDVTPGEIRKTRRITFGWDPGPSGGTGRNPKNQNAPPHFTIDNKQFDPEVIDQTMDLDTAEEWMVENTTGIVHPFHIHINPFQVIEIFDPNGSLGPRTPTPVKLPPPWVWWDNFPIPAGGYFKMWSRFVDFTGKFVMHCHIVGHEDRGMMQAVQVSKKPPLTIPHH